MRSTICAPRFRLFFACVIEMPTMGNVCVSNLNNELSYVGRQNKDAYWLVVLVARVVPQESNRGGRVRMSYGIREALVVPVALVLPVGLVVLVALEVLNND